MWKEYTIKKGEHYSSNKPLISLVSSKIIRFQAIFHSNCLYDPKILGVDADDINKLYGSTDCFSSIHQNSYRIGWRSTGKEIDVFAYMYVDGDLHHQYLASCKPEFAYEFVVGVKDKEYYFACNDKELWANRLKTCAWGPRFRSFPYHGGNRPAPQDLTIDINEL